MALDVYRPDRIFHLAAVAFVPESTLDPLRAIETNTIGSLNILEAVRNLGLKTRIQLCGSSEEYGDSPAPLTEDSVLKPLSPYATAKAAMTHLGQNYARAYGMNIVITRAFNHTGPGRGEMYAESSWAKQIAEIERGDREVITHGDLGAVRNYTDVRDVVRAYAMAIELPSGIYNICSDQNVTMEEVMRTLCSLTEAPVTLDRSLQLFRPNDFSFAKPSNKKFTGLTNWEPQYDLKQTLNDILNEWRRRVTNN